MWIKNRITYLFAFLLVVLYSCEVGKKYQRPEVEFPDQYRKDTSEIFHNENGTGRNWRSIFKDTILISLIEDGLERNYDLRNAVLNIDIASRQLLQSKLLYLPEIDAEIIGTEYTYRSKNFRSPANAKWYDTKDRNAPDNMFLYQSETTSSITASWEIDFWKKFKNQKEADQATLLGTIEAQKAIQNRLITSISKAYFNLVKLDAQIRVAKKNAALNDSTLRMIELQFEAGEITRLALEQTEAQRLIAASLVPQLEQEIAIQENVLRTLTSRFPERIEIVESLNNIIEIDSLIDIGSPIDLMRNRPDVRNAEYQLIAANAEMNIHKALQYPSLNIGGRLGLNAMLPENWFNIPGSLLGSFTAGITTPIFKRRTLKTRYDVAGLQREQAELDLYKMIYESVSEVSNALITIQKQGERLDFAEQRVQNSESAVKNATLLFKSGYATYLEVITAQSSALNSSLDRIDVQQEQLDAVIDLYSALGVSWQ